MRKDRIERFTEIAEGIFSEVLHPRLRGKFAPKPGEDKALARKFQASSGSKISDRERQAMEHFSKDRSGTTLYHRTNSEFMGEPGSTFKSDRPISTSEGDVAKQFGNVVYELHVKKGKTFRPNDYASGFEGEKEHVLAPGTKVKIHSRTKSGNETRIVGHIG